MMKCGTLKLVKKNNNKNVLQFYVHENVVCDIRLHSISQNL